MRKVLIIGCGNPLRSDDGVAWQILEQLERRPGFESVTMIRCHQLTPELAEPISAAHRVIFVDARVGETPVRVSVYRIRSSKAEREPFSHHVDPPALLDCADALFGKRPEAFVASVGIGFLGYGEQLSEVVRNSLDFLRERVVELASGGEVPEARAPVTR